MSSSTSKLVHVTLQCSDLPSSWIWYTLLFEVIIWRLMLIVFSRISSHFQSLSEERKNKVITYTFGVFIRLGGLILCVYAALYYLDANLNMRLDRMNCGTLYCAWMFAICWGASLVIELCVLRTLGWDYWLHHIIVIVSVARFVDGSSGAHSDVIYAGMVWTLSLGGSSFIFHQFTMLMYHLFHDNHTVCYYCMLFRVYEQSILSFSIFFVIAFYQYAINFKNGDLSDKIYNLSVLTLNAMVEVYVTSVIYKIMKKKKKQSKNQKLEQATNLKKGIELKQHQVPKMSHVSTSRVCDEDFVVQYPNMQQLQKTAQPEIIEK